MWYELCEESGMTAHVRNMRGGTVKALLLAVHGGRAEEVERLLAGGLDVNIADEDGITPLMASAMNGHLAIARLLLAAGAYRCMFNKWGMTAHDIAVWHGYDALAALLEDVSDRDTGGAS